MRREIAFFGPVLDTMRERKTFSKLDVHESMQTAWSYLKGITQAEKQGCCSSTF